MVRSLGAGFVRPMRDSTSERRQKELHAATPKPADIAELPRVSNGGVGDVAVEAGGEPPEIDLQYSDRQRAAGCEPPPRACTLRAAPHGNHRDAPRRKI